MYGNGGILENCLSILLQNCVEMINTIKIIIKKKIEKIGLII